MQRRALITGIAGQDGRYLSHLLVSRGYKVYGLLRNTNLITQAPIIPVYGDMLALPELPEVDEVYNLAAVTHVGECFKSVELAYQTNAVAAITLMEWAASIGAKFYQASTSEMYGNTETETQNELTPFRPVSPYGNAKLCAHTHAHMLRRRGHFVCCGILFNHESPFRGANFVTQKITRAAKKGENVTLGNLDSQRDWGHASEYVEGMVRMMNHSEPDDFVLSTGIVNSIKDVLKLAYGSQWRAFVKTSDEHVRPAELRKLCGDSAKARHVLGWRPTLGLPDVIDEMMNHNDSAEFWPQWMNKRLYAA